MSGPQTRESPEAAAEADVADGQRRVRVPDGMELLALPADRREIEIQWWERYLVRRRELAAQRRRSGTEPPWAAAITTAIQ
ncbi:hypothetical protein [Azospirillum sp. sgz302134]